MGLRKSQPKRGNCHRIDGLSGQHTLTRRQRRDPKTEAGIVSAGENIVKIFHELREKDPFLFDDRPENGGYFLDAH